MVLFTGRVGGGLNNSADAVTPGAGNPADDQGNEIAKARLSETGVEAHKQRLQVLWDGWLKHGSLSTSVDFDASAQPSPW
jgi:hypothetical protein